MLDNRQIFGLVVFLFCSLSFLFIFIGSKEEQRRPQEKNNGKA